MDRTSLLRKIKENAGKITAPSRPFLLSIDVDDRYGPKIYPDFKEYYGEFLRTVRHAFNVVHICHSYANEEHAKTKTFGELVSCDNPDRYKTKFPVTRPKTGEWILGKKHFDAFQDSALQTVIPKSTPVFVMGAYGQGDHHSDFSQLWCVDSTILGGLKEGYNMIAIPDMIYTRYVRRDYPEFGKIETIESREILDTLNVEI